MSKTIEELKKENGELRNKNKTYISDMVDKGNEIYKLQQELTELKAKYEEVVKACEFSKGAVEDAIYCEDGLDGAVGEEVIKMIDSALKGDVSKCESCEYFKQELAELKAKYDELEENNCSIGLRSAVEVRDGYISKLESELTELKAKYEEVAIDNLGYGRAIEMLRDSCGLDPNKTDFREVAIKYGELQEKCEDLKQAVASEGRNIIKCPSCGKDWNTQKHNACECGAVIKDSRASEGLGVDSSKYI